MHRFDAQISWPHRWGGKERRRGSCAPGPLACSPLTCADMFGEEVGEGKGGVAYSLLVMAIHTNNGEEWESDTGRQRWRTGEECWTGTVEEGRWAALGRLSDRRHGGGDCRVRLGFFAGFYIGSHGNSP